MTNRSNGNRNDEGSFDTLSDAQTSRFLSLGLSRADHPVDRLVAFLRGRPAEDALTALLEAGPARTCGATGSRILDGKTTLDQLAEIKRRSVQALRSAPTSHASHTATASYLASLAAALVHHDTRLSRRPATELSASFLDLAAIVRPPWSDLFITAAERLEA